MTQIQIFVILSGIALTVLIAWYFWFAPKAQTRVAVSASGAQEVAVTVKGGYTPDVIVVQKGRPVRLTFTRQESSACSEKVLFPDFNQNALLPEGEQVTLEFTPEQSGEYGFQCQMGMLRGKLIVE
ncbi:MAG: cupredoxin domain-containing protein [Anaerolineales bacterium]|jgi:plastocyanin domain-containing protein|nr:cupredoxin domain-containing protein [Anaerolineales bacterium]MBI3170583.1 cupredoxin domain-containing protein [Chloroflexota bacterium]NJC97191.1 cupredoxin domain-containing protein [Anaerolineae bacterium]GJQ35041.1 MAG: ATPase [Anaerolineaceae bacterium]MBE7435507.1 cupredoxin domain-containing protein [Anaerolineales bacterium]